MKEKFKRIGLGTLAVLFLLYWGIYSHMDRVVIDGKVEYVDKGKGKIYKEMKKIEKEKKKQLEEMKESDSSYTESTNDSENVTVDPEEDYMKYYEEDYKDARIMDEEMWYEYHKKNGTLDEEKKKLQEFANEIATGKRKIGKSNNSSTMESESTKSSNNYLVPEKEVDYDKLEDSGIKSNSIKRIGSDGKYVSDDDLIYFNANLDERIISANEQYCDFKNKRRQTEEVLCRDGERINMSILRYTHYLDGAELGFYKTEKGWKFTENVKSKEEFLISHKDMKTLLESTNNTDDLNVYEENVRNLIKAYGFDTTLLGRNIEKVLMIWCINYNGFDAEDMSVYVKVNGEFFNIHEKQQRNILTQFSENEEVEEYSNYYRYMYKNNLPNGDYTYYYVDVPKKEFVVGY